MLINLLTFLAWIFTLLSVVFLIAQIRDWYEYAFTNKRKVWEMIDDIYGIRPSFGLIVAFVVFSISVIFLLIVNLS